MPMLTTVNKYITTNDISADCVLLRLMLLARRQKPSAVSFRMIHAMAITYHTFSAPLDPNLNIRYLGLRPRKV